METLIQPLQLVEFRSNANEAVLLSGRAGDLLPGDLLRFTCRLGEMRYQLMLVPDWIETLNSNPRSSRLRMQWKDGRWSSIVVARDPDEKDTMPAAGRAVRIHWQKSRWFRIPGPPDAPLSGRARLHGSPAEPPWITAWQRESIRWETGKPVQLALYLEPGQSPEPGRLVEVEFGTERAPEALREVVVAAALPGETPVWVRGAIDRVDLGPGVAAVVYYKGKVPVKVKERLLVSEFQMPLYF